MWYRSVFKSFTGGCQSLVILSDLLVLGNQQDGLKIKIPLVISYIMEPRSNACSASSFSIDNILGDKKEEGPTDFQFVLPTNPAELVRPTFQMFPPFLCGSLNTWPHYQPHNCPPFDRSRKTTGKWFENNVTFEVTK